MNVLASLLVLLSKFTLAMLAAKVVPRGSRGVPRRLEGRHFGRLWGSLGIAWDPFVIIFGSFSRHLGSFGDHFLLFWGSFWDLPGIIWEPLFFFFGIRF